MDPGNGSLYNTGVSILPLTTVVSVDTNGTLDLNGAYQTVAGLQNGGGGGGDRFVCRATGKQQRGGKLR